MLMLIKIVHHAGIIDLYFNTSHVNVNQINPQIISQAKANFNTSHVNVNHNLPVRTYILCLFQYISC